jgi:hypothetical protein
MSVRLVYLYRYFCLKILTYVIFSFIWSTLVYDFITYWTWAPNGWLHAFGALDFAGIFLTKDNSNKAFKLKKYFLKLRWHSCTHNKWIFGVSLRTSGRSQAHC